MTGLDQGYGDPSSTSQALSEGPAGIPQRSAITEGQANSADDSYPRGESRRPPGTTFATSRVAWPGRAGRAARGSSGSQPAGSGARLPLPPTSPVAGGGPEGCRAPGGGKERRGAPEPPTAGHTPPGASRKENGSRRPGPPRRPFPSPKGWASRGPGPVSSVP